MIQKSLYRSSDRILAGVCGGLADYLGLDRSMVRLATLIGILFLGLSVWVYVFMWLIVPEEPGRK
ncbi:PspC domain-containing protein [uncultured Alistipes sp.]|uniref:PspC domain-containing protein n=1 Tax=uncultured Alistipes sp. TaxID=538949 RepID=UPI00261C812D|nr:PspC domain-containing protein [uncultured Alistipes sp.]